MGKRLPSNCRYCNAQFDLMSIMPKEQAEAKGLLKMPEEPKPQSEEPEVPAAAPAAPPAAPTPPQPAGFGVNRPAQPTLQQPPQTGFGMNQPAQPAPAQPPQTGFGVNRPAQPAPQQPPQTGFGMNRQMQPAPQQPMHSGFGMNRPVQPAMQTGFGMNRPPQQPAQSGFGMGYAAPSPAYRTPAVQEWQLDFFGEKIPIPQEGGWLGRSAIGNEWFKGNLLISREHIRITPMPDGSLQVGSDKSLNGTFVTIGGTKRALERSETVALSPGDTLWLYTVPLQLERK